MSGFYTKLAKYKYAYLSVLTFVFVLILWEIVARTGILGIPKFVLPAPSQVIVEFQTSRIPWLEHMYVTFYEIVLGFIFGVLIGSSLAILISMSRLLRNIVYPYMLLSQLIPKIAIAPIFMLWLGYGVLPKLVIAFLITFFPMFINTLDGLESIEPEILEVVHSLRASRWQIYTKIRLPNSLPFVFSGMKIGATVAVVGALVAEYLASDSGLGFLINFATYYARTKTAFSAVGLLTIIGVAFYLFVLGMERVMLPWYTIPRQQAKKEAGT
ncbi:MAG: ABC transporter permease [Promethearchaeota archaeon]